MVASGDERQLTNSPTESSPFASRNELNLFLFLKAVSKYFDFRLIDSRLQNSLRETSFPSSKHFSGSSTATTDVKIFADVTFNDFVIFPKKIRALVKHASIVVSRF